MPDGRSIEQHYQCDIKGYDPGGTNWRLGKGRPPLDPQTDLWGEYLKLWTIWAFNHPQLISELKHLASRFDNVLSDRFATTPINQAHALSVLLNDQMGEGVNNIMVESPKNESGQIVLLEPIHPEKWFLSEEGSATLLKTISDNNWAFEANDIKPTDITGICFSHNPDIDSRSRIVVSTTIFEARVISVSHEELLKLVVVLFPGLIVNTFGKLSEWDSFSIVVHEKSFGYSANTSPATNAKKDSVSRILRFRNVCKSIPPWLDSKLHVIVETLEKPTSVTYKVLRFELDVCAPEKEM